MTNTTGYAEELWVGVNAMLDSIITNELEIQALLDDIASMDDEPTTSTEEDNNIFFSPDEIAYLTALAEIDLEDDF